MITKQELMFRIIDLEMQVLELDERINKLEKRLNEEWEDAPEEEPKEHWIINAISGIETTDRDETDEPGRAMIEIGNYFDTREEAEKAVEKLKAWKRLRDKGFRFTGFSSESIGYEIKELSGDFALDLDLLFNGGANG